MYGKEEIAKYIDEAHETRNGQYSTAASVRAIAMMMYNKMYGYRCTVCGEYEDGACDSGICPDCASEGEYDNGE